MITTEAPAQQEIRIEAGRLNAPLWRNNSGAFYDGMRQVRYGLGNESKALNDVWKSSDLIGPTPILITPSMVGHFVAVFTAIEVKPPDWHIVPSDHRAAAQSVFHDMVRQRGGFAGFARSVEEYRKIIRL